MAEDSESDESSESDEEMSEEPEPEPVEPLLKPVFIKREDRDTIIEKEKKEIEEQNKLEKVKLKKVEKEKEVHELVKKTVEEENKSDDGEGDTEMPDDTDHPENELEEYEKWKLREFERIRRDLEEREREAGEKEEIERRRQLTDEQREVENKKLGSDKTEHKEGRKYNFMQKYYKLGPYYMDNAKKGGKWDILNRDYNAPLAEEKRDVSTLPRVMQLRRGEFGKRGQSKWTHLTNEDTTNFDPTYKVPENLFKKTQGKLGGYKSSQDFEKPTKRRKYI
jgi:microfibrillar-associated protein 1